MTEKIPGPRALPFLGNLLDVWNDRAIPLLAMERIADTYGPIYQATIKGQRRIFCSSATLLEELTDEKRFVKVPPSALADTPGPKGLFTARNENPDWGQAHRILMPAFSPLSIRDMFDDMKDIANQLILKWARNGQENRILLTDDFTRLTLDTIALCTMAYRFNSFYQESMHPFVDAMLNVLTENGARVTRPGLVTSLMFTSNSKYEENRKFLRKVGLQIVEDRRAHPVEKKDVLNAMIYGVDPKTGQTMRDELISEQMTTFLIAGHETTSGLLSFAFMNLLKNPQTYLKAQKEVDEVVGRAPIQIDHLKNLKYLNAVLRETARLTPTVPMFSKQINPALVHEPVTLDHGRYKIEPSDQIVVLVGKSQKDPNVWGEDAAEFKPERVSDEEFDKIAEKYPGAWKPFGNGKRACIGRPFAWQEATLVIAMVLQNFDMQLDDPSYQMKYKQTLTIKPLDLYVRVKPRNNVDATCMDRLIHTNGVANGVSDHSQDQGKATINTVDSESLPMTILYGSNTGTCQAFAQRLASDAATRGFKPLIMDMDAAVGALPRSVPVVIITASYEGQPPDNAARFIEWLQSCKEGSLSGIDFAVFGCGHRDWARTFHRIPKLTDELMARCGGHRIAPAGFTDAAKGNMYSEFEDWLDDSFWAHQSWRGTGGTQDAAMSIEISTNARASSLRYDVSLATIKGNERLTLDGEPTKCHMEIQLPSDSKYECGDYLAILPLNSEKNVKRIMAHFQLPWDAVVTLKTKGPSTIPANTPLSVFDVLRSYVELSQPATKKNLNTCARYTEDPKAKAYLESTERDANIYDSEIVHKRTSLFDLLHHYPSIGLPFSEFLALLPPLHLRQYSISSSPLAKADSCTITYGVIESSALSDPGLHFEGVAGTYLNSLHKGDSIQVSIRPSTKKTFRLPLNPQNTPLLMFCAGTGLAPFHGFLQQRAMQMEANPDRTLARAVVFVGCRSPKADRLYAEEMDEWAKKGVVEVKYAFSRESGASENCAYVPERMIKDAEDIVSLWRADARVYICGSRQFAEGVGQAARSIALEVQQRKGAPSEAERVKRVEGFMSAIQERVASDVFD